ncbi:MAG TPA: hypothetical protein VFR56_10170 [Actinomycetes bacterium]|nr:hypothetical protein [Actinomycetes bacterium]
MRRTCTSLADGREIVYDDLDGSRPDRLAAGSRVVPGSERWVAFVPGGDGTA